MVWWDASFENRGWIEHHFRILSRQIRLAVVENSKDSFLWNLSLQHNHLRLWTLKCSSNDFLLLAHAVMVCAWDEKNPILAICSIIYNNSSCACLAFCLCNAVTRHASIPQCRLDQGLVVRVSFTDGPNHFNPHILLALRHK